jgi:uncharacterized protein (DUF2252 family)
MPLTVTFADLTVEERMERGRAARTVAPRTSHADWAPAPDRPDPLALLEEQAASRLPQLVPIRHGRMLASPFAFYRGAALIMGADLAATPRSGILLQLCGDAHLSNFGVYASPERQMLFDINDFDETLPGPWEWDVKRLAASFEVAGRDLGFAPRDRRDIVLAGMAEYRRIMRESSLMGVLEAWYAYVADTDILRWIATAQKEGRLDKKDANYAAKDVVKARARVHARALRRLTRQLDGSLRIQADPPLIVPIADLAPDGMARDEIEEWMRTLVQSYRQSVVPRHHPIEEFSYLDTALKVVGVGSVGTRAWILLFAGRDHEDALFLQAKEAQPSVLERYTGASQYDNHGERVVRGQRLMQAASDVFLGWLRLEGLDGRERDYYVRQLHDWKGSFEIERLGVPGAMMYARLCGATLARAHARHGDRVAIAAYLGKGDQFDRALADFAVAYADQNERDYEVFAAAVKTGRLQAQIGL